MSSTRPLSTDDFHAAACSPINGAPQLGDDSPVDAAPPLEDDSLGDAAPAAPSGASSAGLQALAAALRSKPGLGAVGAGLPLPAGITARQLADALLRRQAESAPSRPPEFHDVVPGLPLERLKDAAAQGRLGLREVVSAVLRTQCGRPGGPTQPLLAARCAAPLAFQPVDPRRRPSGELVWLAGADGQRRLVECLKRGDRSLAPALFADGVPAPVVAGLDMGKSGWTVQLSWRSESQGAAKFQPQHGEAELLAVQLGWRILDFLERLRIPAGTPVALAFECGSGAAALWDWALRNNIYPLPLKSTAVRQGGAAKTDLIDARRLCGAASELLRQSRHGGDVVALQGMEALDFSIRSRSREKLACDARRAASRIQGLLASCGAADCPAGDIQKADFGSWSGYDGSPLPEGHLAAIRSLQSLRAACLAQVAAADLRARAAVERGRAGGREDQWLREAAEVDALARTPDERRLSGELAAAVSGGAAPAAAAAAEGLLRAQAASRGLPPPGAGAESRIRDAAVLAATESARSREAAAERVRAEGVLEASRGRLEAAGRAVEADSRRIADLRVERARAEEAAAGRAASGRRDGAAARRAEESRRQVAEARRQVAEARQGHRALTAARTTAAAEAAAARKAAKAAAAAAVRGERERMASRNELERMAGAVGSRMPARDASTPPGGAQLPCEAIAAKLAMLRGFGVTVSMILAAVFAGRRFFSAGAVAALVGLVDVPSDSGRERRSTGVGQSGCGLARSRLVEIAALLPRFLPASPIVQWALARMRPGQRTPGRRDRVAMARRLAEAVWRWVAFGELTAGLRLKPEFETRRRRLADAA